LAAVIGFDGAADGAPVEATPSCEAADHDATAPIVAELPRRSDDRERQEAVPAPATRTAVVIFAVAVAAQVVEDAVANLALYRVRVVEESA
jgi:hypothetical protein